jgi:parallel beta-helix repeat protein
MKSKKCFIRFIGALCLTLVSLILSEWLLCTSNSFAGGAKEISQKDVPLVITKPGSYYLISNLIVSSPNVTAISIGADNVTIDLNGFTISGPGMGIGTGFGIVDQQQTLPGLVNNAVVRGGTVRGWAYAVHLAGKNNRVENVRVFEASHGIFVGRSSVVSQCQVAFGGVGIGTDDGTMVLNNTIYSMDNRCIGTSGGAAPPLGGVTVIGNNCRLSPIGIRVQGQGNRIEGNTITLCGIGIDLSEGTANYFAKNFLQGNVTAWIPGSVNQDGGEIDLALSNIILP